jgi:MFS family permease
MLSGFLADRYGRRLTCVIFCVLHPLAAVSILSDRIEILYIGRVLAGVALTLLWTVFESWMVTEFKARELHRGSVTLSNTFGIITTSNCIAAILSSVLGQGIVWVSGSRTNPFLAGVV